MRIEYLFAGLLLCSSFARATTLGCKTTPGTYNASSGASWVGGVAPNLTGGDRMTCATNGVTINIDVNMVIGDSPAVGTNVVSFTAGSSLRIAPGVILKSQGDYNLAGTGSTIETAGATLLFDSSGASSPTTTHYSLKGNGNFTFDGVSPPTLASRFIITSNVATGIGALIAPTTAGAGMNLATAIVSNCGDRVGVVKTFVASVTSGSNSIVYVSGGFPNAAAAGQPLTDSLGLIPSGATLTGQNAGFNVVVDSSHLPTGTNSSDTMTILTPLPCVSYTPGGSGILQIGMVAPAPTVTWSQFTPPPPCGSACAPVTFDNTCGIAWGAGTTSSDGYNLDVTFKNTQAGCPPFSINEANSPTGGTLRTTTNTVFADRTNAPILNSPGSTWNMTFFGIQFVNGSASGATVPMTFKYPWFLVNTKGGLELSFGFHAVQAGALFADALTTYSAGTFHAAPPFKSGTLTAATSTLLTDSTASFPNTMVDGIVLVGGVNTGFGYGVCMKTGAAAGQCRAIVSNTTTSVTPNFPFNPPPAIGDAYTTTDGGENAHFTGFSFGSASATVAQNFDGLVAWFHGCDPTGDIIHSANGAHIAYGFNYWTMLPNNCLNNSGTDGTYGSATGLSYSLTHHTLFVGQQGPSACEGCTPQTGKFAKLNYFAYWDDPKVDYVTAGGNVGPYKLTISQGTLPTAENTDEFATNCFGGSSPCLDYNYSFGLVPFSASGNANGYCSLHIAGCNAGYNVFSSAFILGLHDKDGVDPLFANRWGADPIHWGYSLGCPNSGDLFQDFACVLNGIILVNEPGYDPRFSPSAYQAWVARSLAPHNATYCQPLPDGTSFIGAWPCASSAGFFRMVR